MESRRSLAKLLNIRGRAAVRWQESVSGAVGRIAVGKARAGRVVRSGDSGDEDDDDAFADAFEDKKTNRLVKARSSESDEDEETIECVSTGEPAAQSWSVLFEDRNRQPVIIGLGLCFLAAFSGSNTVIYFASSVLQEADSRTRVCSPPPWACPTFSAASSRSSPRTRTADARFCC
jgi:hypothetical protein